MNAISISIDHSVPESSKRIRKLPEILAKETSDSTIFFRPNSDKNGRFLSFMPLKFACMGEEVILIDRTKNRKIHGRVANFWHDRKMALEIIRIF